MPTPMAGARGEADEGGAALPGLEEQVRDALRHVHDYAYLQTHPLTRVLPAASGREPAEAGQHLGRQLRDAIAALQPDPVAASAAAQRRARLLALRYLDELEPPVVQRRLAISRSTYQREHAAALAAVTSLLRTRWRLPMEAPLASGPDVEAVTPTAPPHESAFLTSFVGRERELATVNDVLDRARLVTLTGSPGAGKTRLADEVAARRRAGYAHGVYFVPLAPCRVAEEVAPAIARALSVRELSGQPLPETLKAALRERHVLLVLDNFEQVVTAAPLVSDLLRAAPRLTVLATSRAPLRVSGEHVCPVPPLALPADASVSPAALAAAEAVRLFVDRARAAEPGFTLSDATVATVAEICRRLDGLPLAIELAAAHLRVLSPASLLVRLHHRLSLLKAGAQDLPVRQRTLRAAIDWSYDLLGADEQALLRDLAAFDDGFTLDAAEHMWAAGGRLLDVVAGLAALVDQGLLRRDEQAGGEARFALLESVREYALERLLASGEVGQVQREHAAYYRRLAEEGDHAYFAAAPAEHWQWVGRLEAEQANLRAALRWCEAHGTPDQLAAMAGSLAWFWLTGNYWTEGRYWLDRALAAQSDPAGEASALALLGAGIFALAQGDLGTARSRLDRSVALLRGQGRPSRLAKALGGLASVLARDGDPAAWPIGVESLEIFRRLGNHRAAASVQLQLGSIATDLGDYARARALLAEGRAYSLQIGDQASVASADWRLGSLAMAQRDYQEARRRLEQSLAAFRAQASAGGVVKQGMAVALTRLAELEERDGAAERAAALGREALHLARGLGDKDVMAWALVGLGGAARRQGDWAGAETLLREALLLRQAQGHAWAMLACLGELAEIAMQAGQRERAVRLFAAVAGLQASRAAPPLGDDRPGPDARRVEQQLATLRAELAPARFEAGWADGAALTLEEAAAYALHAAATPLGVAANAV